VGRPGLHRAAIAHQRLDRIGLRCPGELLALALLAVHDGHGEDVLGELLVQRENPQCLFLRFLGRLVRGVALLPEELRRPQERTRHLLPPDDVRPLVDEHRQVAPRLNPLLVHHADDGFRRGTHHQSLFEVLGASPRDPGHLRRETFDVLGLAHQQALGNEQREVRIHVPGGLEAVVELTLDELPDRIAIGADDHAAFHGRVVGQLRLPDDIQVPLGEVLGLGGDLLHERVSGRL
jgi:hypothetical protein